MSDNDKNTATRRDFLKGLAAGAVAGVVVTTGIAVATRPKPATVTKTATSTVTETTTSTVTVPGPTTTTTTTATVKIPEVKTIEVSKPAVVKGEKGWQLDVDFDKCSGCRLCEIACSVKHFGVINPELSRIRVIRLYPGIDVPVFCRQCPSHPCIEVCPVKALSVDETTGAIKVDKEKCIHCGKCAEVCPAKAIRFHPDEGWPLICDLCGLEPECVKICPQNALNWGNVAVDTTHQAKSPIEILKEVTTKYGVPLENLKKIGQID